MRVVCVSDTHGLHDDAVAIPSGDVFVHAGDFTDTGERREVLAFNAFVGRLPHRYKLVIAGNHESSFDRAFYPQFWHQYGHQQQYDPNEVRSLLTNALYLEDQAVLIDGFLFYGTPWQPEFCNWAFNLPRGEALRERWRHIPTETDVLITHTPPMGHGDLVGNQRVGCVDLLHEVESRVRPKLHVFGHVHEGYGRSVSPDGSITYLNASLCTHDYEPVNLPFVFELTGPPKRGRSVRTSLLTSSSAELSIPRSLSSNDVSILSRTGSKDKSQSLTGAEPRDYDLMLHEWLRLCSHKPMFTEETLAKEGTTAEPEKENLREFRVDGTTSGLLFESTLRVRPVRNVEKRALRYLFSQGFRNNSENYKAEDALGREAVIHDEKVEEDAALKLNGEDRHDRQATRERHNHSISRRMTVAVLDKISESKEAIDDRDHLQSSRVAAAALGGDTSVAMAGRCRRPQRNKTLQRRSVVPILAALSEEQSEGEDTQIDTPDKRSVQGVATEDVTNLKTLVECALCKYKVAGHIHPGAPPVPAFELLEETELEAKEVEMPTETRSTTEGLPHKRLSSWF